MKLRFKTVLLALLLTGCAGMQRSCSNQYAESFGADWIIVQYDFNLAPKKCWVLEDTSVTNEEASDGIHWKSPHGHMVHIAGWYNRVQVSGKDWKVAGDQLGVDPASCLGYSAH